MSIYARRQMMGVGGSIKFCSFAGLNIAPGPLYFDGTNFSIKDHWNNTSYNSVYGRNAGSTFFSYIDVGMYFDSDGANFSTQSGSIDNTNTLSFGGKSGWRIATYAELTSIFSYNSAGRTGATVNGTSGCFFAHIRNMSGITWAGASSYGGTILFPDNETITGKALSGVNSTTSTTGFTEADLNEYLNQGCVFLPEYGTYTTYSNRWFTGSCYNSSSDEYNVGNTNFIDSRPGAFNTGTLPKTTSYTKWHLVRTI